MFIACHQKQSQGTGIILGMVVCCISWLFTAENCRDLQIPRLNTEHAKKSYRYSAIKVWNEIPVAVRELPTISLFKKRTKGVLEELTENTTLIKNTTLWKNSILG